MIQLAINITGTLAKSSLNDLKIILDHDFVVSNATTDIGSNLVFSQALFKSVYCRAVDIFQDCLCKLVKEVVQKLDLNDPKLVYAIPAKRLNTLLNVSNPKQNIEEHLSSTLGYQLKRLRDYAINLQMPITQGVEAIIQTRNVIVHKNGEIDDRLVDLYGNTNNDLIIPDIVQSRVKLDKAVTYKSIELLSDTIQKIETVMNENYNIDWTYIDKKCVGEPLKFFDWSRKKKKNIYSD